MRKDAKRYTITAALPYANGPIHIGHLAGVYLPADIFARYLRRKQKDVVFISGSDEYGVAVSIRAKKEGISPQKAVDKYHFIIKESLEAFGISFDNYSRSSLKVHHETSREFFKNLYDQGDFIEEDSEQYYDPKAKEFLADRYILGTCPTCSYKEAYGDQCEKCGRTLSPRELNFPRSVLSGEEPILKKTKHWYLPLDKYENFLREWILEGKKNQWKTNVYGQVSSWVNEGLKPRALTRDLDWGIPVPIKGAEGKVLYVWFEAPIGYISSTIEWAQKNKKDWRPYWQDEGTDLIHFIGKDNIVFHCIIFPSMLKAHGGYILPEDVAANEFLNLEGEKISTSRNWAIWLDEYLKDFSKKEDALRYCLIANMPENKDSNFSWKEFQNHNNSELVAILGNFIHRSLILVQKYYAGEIPTPGDFTQKDKNVLDEIKKYPNTIGMLIEKYCFRDALAELMKLARLGNKYLAEEEPWKISKTQPQRVKTILYTSMQIAGMIAQLVDPFLPHTGKKLLHLLKLDPIPWDNLAKKELLPSSTLISDPDLLFEKISDELIEEQVKKLENASSY